MEIKEDVYVFISKIPQVIDYKNVYPLEKDNEIKNCLNEDLKRQKYWAWITLENAIMQIFDKKIDKYKFHQSENGKWLSSFNFSISHSDEYVAVAIANNIVGIDLQVFDDKDHLKLLKKILTTHELNNSDILSSEQIINIWCQKEAIYKMLDDKTSFKNIETSNFNCINKKYILNNKEYILSICYQDTFNMQASFL